MKKNQRSISEVADIPIPEPSNAGIDLPDYRDWHYSDIIEELGGSDTSDLVYIMSWLNIYNQGANTLTKNACGFYGITHDINAQNIVNGYSPDTQIDPKGEWIDYNQQRNEADKYTGTSIQGNLNWFAAELKLISGYGKVNSIEQAKKAIDNRHFIYTGSNNGDWTSVRVDHKYKLRSDGDIVGHLFCLIGYNDEGFIAINSYGNDNGYFTIPYALYDTLYSKYAVLSNKDLPAVNKYKMTKTIQEALKEAISLGITDGTRENEPATRGEVVAMVVRALDVAIQKGKDLFVSK